MANRVYTAILRQPQILPAGDDSWHLNIENENRRFKIKSISLDIAIYDPASGVPLPLEQNITQFFELTIYTASAIPFASPFNIGITPAGCLVENGKNMLIKRTGQLLYDSFFISNQLTLVFLYRNNDALITYAYNTCISIETEDEILKFAK